MRRVENVMGSLDESWFRPEAFLNHYKSTWKSTILSNCVHSSQHKHTEEKLKSKTHENAHPNERFFFKVQVFLKFPKVDILPNYPKMCIRGGVCGLFALVYMLRQICT